MKKLLLFLCLFAVAIPTALGDIAASDPSMASILQDLEAFESIAFVPDLKLLTPKVVEIPLSNTEIGYDFAVLEKNSFTPYAIISSKETAKISSSFSQLIDGSTKTYEEFSLPEQGSGETEIVLSSDEEIISSSMQIMLDANVALPSTIEIAVKSGTEEKVVLSKTKMTGRAINFPEEISKEWIIRLTFIQPLRITEIAINQENPEQLRSLRFLAKPNFSYIVYANPDRPTNVSTGESANLNDSKDILTLDAPTFSDNPNYFPADTDADGIKNTEDNCVSIANADQADLDGNGRGDACEDYDKDGIIGSVDNCLNDPNRLQEDTDADGIGDICDSEESRLTEKYPFLPWLGMGLAAAVIGVLFWQTAKPAKR